MSRFSESRCWSPTGKRGFLRVGIGGGSPKSQPLHDFSSQSLQYVIVLHLKNFANVSKLEISWIFESESLDWKFPELSKKCFWAGNFLNFPKCVSGLRILVFPQNSSGKLDWSIVCRSIAKPFAFWFFSSKIWTWWLLTSEFELTRVEKKKKFHKMCLCFRIEMPITSWNEDSWELELGAQDSFQVDLLNCDVLLLYWNIWKFIVITGEFLKTV